MLIVAIALPFYVLTRAEHLHRLEAKPPTHSSAQASVQRRDQGLNDPSGDPAPSAQPQSLPVTAASATPRPTTAVHQKSKGSSTRPSSTPSSGPAPTSTATPAPAATGAPVAKLSVSTQSGPAPLTVTSDASGSTDTVQITSVLIGCGNGLQPEQVAFPWITTCQYGSSGTYTISVVVFDATGQSSSAESPITVTP